MISFWALFFIVSYFGIVFILIKGKQHNRFFGTFLSTIFPVVGSVPAYVMACKYEKRISNKTKKINNNIIKYIIAGMQALSIIMMFAPFYKVGSQSVNLINLLFGSTTYGGVIKPVIFLSYIAILPVISILLNLCFKKSNVSNFVTYFTSFINIFSVLIYGFIITTFENISSTPFIWVFAIFNVFIMALSFVSLISNRDDFLFKLEYSEKIEYVKEQKKKAAQEKKTNSADEKKPVKKSTYKCAKCGKQVEKGQRCTCSLTKKEADKSPEKTDKPKTDAFSSASVCRYCKKPLKIGEECQCQNKKSDETVTPEPKESRKCKYCGQVLVGDSTCVCEKIMKNSDPGQDKNESKKYFDSKVEKGDMSVAAELAELEKSINSKFEHVKDNIDSSDK